MELKNYNIRVYGLLINAKQEILLSEEHRFGLNFTKFPGGGHELGEGIKDTLQREFREELGISICVKEHFYTTDFLQVSAFNQEEQLISIYYFVESKEIEQVIHGMKAIDVEQEDEHIFLWKKIDELLLTDVTYPIDQLVVTKLCERKNL